MQLALGLFLFELVQSGTAFLDEDVGLVIFGIERRRVDGRVEGLAFPPDHGFAVHVISDFRSLDISIAEKHVGGGLIRIRSLEPSGQCQ